MITIDRKKYNILRIRELYFADSFYIEKNPKDISLYIQSKVPFKKSKEFHTLHIDLTKTEQEIFLLFGKNNKYKIRRAEDRDLLQYYIFSKPEKEMLKVFVDSYNKFANQKKLAKCNEKKLIEITKKNALTISFIRDTSGEILCCHAYISDSKRARLLYSASLFREQLNSKFRNKIGRANRYLHWRDILEFKKSGFCIYDLGGIGNSLDTKNIDEFKRSFGGKEVIEYNNVVSRNLLGKLASMKLASL